MNTYDRLFALKMGTTTLHFQIEILKNTWPFPLNKTHEEEGERNLMEGRDPANLQFIDI